MEKLKVFVIMPFQDVFFEVYEMLKRELGEKYEFSNAGDEGNQQNILKDIIQPIYEADIIIADLTGLNSNVLYELGIAHTLNKKTIVITQNDLNSLPFDLKQYRAKDYSTHFKKFAQLLEYLKVNLDGAIDGSIVYSNPINDFISLNLSNKNISLCQEKISIDIDNTDKGFLDFYAEIEEDTYSLTNYILKMTSDLASMTSGIEASTHEIERVSNNGGNGTTSFVRKETKKVAKYMDTYSTKLREYNMQYTSLWNKIERNTLGLLENKYVENGKNKEALTNYLKSLNDLKASILDANKSVSYFRAASKNNEGIERSLNQAIKFLDDDLCTYLNIMGQITTSINKIIEKSKFVVGTLDFSNTIENGII